MNTGLTSFALSPGKWVEKTDAIGILVKGGRYGGTYAHKDIAFEFTIVLLLLHRSPFTGRIFDNDSLEKMKRNLIYVSLTRAMDHVNVFVLDGEREVDIMDLVGVFEEMLL